VPGTRRRRDWWEPVNSTPGNKGKVSKKIRLPQGGSGKKKRGKSGWSLLKSASRGGQVDRPETEGDEEDLPRESMAIDQGAEKAKAPCV